MTSARARKDPRQQTSSPPKGEGLIRKPNGPAHYRGTFLCATKNAKHVGKKNAKNLTDGSRIAQ
jgi:hypothetical protein